MTESQRNVTSIMAPPGTYFNPPARQTSHLQQSQTQLAAPQFDSDDEYGPIHDFDADSEDELAKSDPSNIPAAPVANSFKQFQYQPTKSASTSQSQENGFRSTSFNKKHTFAAIDDYHHKEMAERICAIFTDIPEDKVITMLRKKKWNENDAMDALSSIDEVPRGDILGSEGDIDLLTPIKPKPQPSRVVPPVLINKHTTQFKGSLAARLNQPTKRLPELKPRPTTSSQIIEVDSPPKPKRRKLVRGTERAARSPSPDIEIIQPQPAKKQKIVIDLALSDTETEEEETPEVQDTSDKSLLKFFNSCSIAELVDLASTTEEIAKLIISRRPFRSDNQIRKVEDTAPKKGRRGYNRAVGERILDVSEQMWEGLLAIDQLTESCAEIGRSVKSGMEQLNLRTNGTEIEAVELKSSGADSGIGTPSPDPDAIVRLHQPKIMADDFKLKDYQLVALNWLNLMWRKGICPILADEMGLGKTACVIAFLSHLWEQGDKGTHLIIVPGSTLENWVREFQRFSPQIEVYAYHGTHIEREEMRMQVLENPPEVVITTYDMARNDNDNKLFRALKPRTITYDEGHYLKNRQSARYKQLMKIKTPWRLLLTGTPLQNNLQELCSILAFIMPDLFVHVEDHLGYIFKHRAKTFDAEHSALLSAQRVDRARKMMAPFILRRRKEQVLKSMPPKTSRVEYCDMTSRQKEVYDDYTAIHVEAMQDRANGKATELRNHLMERRKAAVHPLLFRYIYDNAFVNKHHKKLDNGKYKKWSDQTKEEEMSWWSDFKIHQTCLEHSNLSKYALKHDEWMDSGKVTKLVELLHAFIKEGSRTLLFSQFTQVLDILESVLETESIKFCRMDGSTNVAQRQQYIDDFHDDESLKVFMLSTKAGGTGINLACANKVIIFDSSFNPHEDVQAENRAHRVGQTREVEVVRLVTRGTIEEQIMRLGQSKLALDQLVSGEEKEGAADLKGMALVEKMLLGGTSHDTSTAVSDDEKNKEEAADKVTTKETSGSIQREPSDVKDDFLNGLKASGLDVKA